MGETFIITTLLCNNITFCCYCSQPQFRTNLTAKPLLPPTGGYVLGVFIGLFVCLSVIAITPIEMNTSLWFFFKCEPRKTLLKLTTPVDSEFASLALQ